MATTTVTLRICDFCLRRMNEHAAYKQMGYLSDGAGVMNDFCDAPGCIEEARGVYERHKASGCQIWLPRTK